MLFRSIFIFIIFSSFTINAAWEEETVVYDDFNDGGASYDAKWSKPFYGVAGETLDSEGGNLNLSFPNGKFKASAPEFGWSSDFIFFDHIKYLAVSNAAFPIPLEGSITISADITAKTFNTFPGLVMNANKVIDGSAVAYELLEGRQAGVTLHMLNFHETGQLFDWFVYGNKAFVLIEKLFNPADINTTYTQIVDEVEISPGEHTFSITYTRGRGSKDRVDYLIDGKIISSVKTIGIPLDQQSPKFYEKKPITDPSQGPGELVDEAMDTMLIGHGLFSLLDVFPYQQEDLEGTSVTIPVTGPAPSLGDPNPQVSSRIWGQGAEGVFDNFKVTTRTKVSN